MIRLALALVCALAAMPASAQSLAPAGAEACYGCHAAGTVAGAPLASLRGMKADDMAAALLDFRSDKRPATLMNRIAKGFSEDEIRAISAWLAAQP